MFWEKGMMANRMMATLAGRVPTCLYATQPSIGQWRLWLSWLPWPPWNSSSDFLWHFTRYTRNTSTVYRYPRATVDSIQQDPHPTLSFLVPLQSHFLIYKYKRSTCSDTSQKTHSTEQRAKVSPRENEKLPLRKCVGVVKFCSFQFKHNNNNNNDHAVHCKNLPAESTVGTLRRFKNVSSRLFFLNSTVTSVLLLLISYNKEIKY